LQAAEDEESRIRNSMWIDPRDADTLFSDFAEEWYEAVRSRLAPTTAAKYRSYLDKQLLPQWRSWPVIGIFNSYLEIEKWVSELHEDYAESSVAAYFALFSTIMNACVRARTMPANPCYGIRVTSGGYEPERLVATPGQGVRAAMRLYELGLGLGGFTLCLANLYTGGRWGELAGQQRHEYDEINRAIGIREPLKEVGGKLFKGGVDVTAPPLVAGKRPNRRVRRGARTKTPDGTRWVRLPPSIATFYEKLLGSHGHLFVFVSPEGRPWYRSNFRERFWRPAWDGVAPNDPGSEHTPAILPWFTFHEGRHTHSTWLAQDQVPEVARRARLGHKMRGMGRVYEHVTPEMERQIIDALEARWASSLLALRTEDQEKLLGWFPHLGPVIEGLRRGREVEERQVTGAVPEKLISQISPMTSGDPASHGRDRADDLGV
jgi:integrase